MATPKPLWQNEAVRNGRPQSVPMRSASALDSMRNFFNILPNRPKTRQNTLKNAPSIKSCEEIPKSTSAFFPQIATQSGQSSYGRPYTAMAVFVPDPLMSVSPRKSHSFSSSVDSSKISTEQPIKSVLEECEKTEISSQAFIGDRLCKVAVHSPLTPTIAEELQMSAPVHMSQTCAQVKEQQPTYQVPSLKFLAGEAIEHGQLHKDHDMDIQIQNVVHTDEQLAQEVQSSKTLATKVADEHHQPIADMSSSICNTCVEPVAAHKVLSLEALATQVALEHGLLSEKGQSVLTPPQEVPSTLHDESLLIQKVPTLMTLTTKAVQVHGLLLDKEDIGDILVNMSSIPHKEPPHVLKVLSLNDLATKASHEHGLRLDKKPGVDTPSPKVSIAPTPVIQKMPTLKALATNAARENGLLLDKEKIGDILPNVSSILHVEPPLVHSIPSLKDPTTQVAHDHGLLPEKDPNFDTLSPKVSSILHDEPPFIHKVPALMAIATRTAQEHGLLLSKEEICDIMPKVPSILHEEPLHVHNIRSLNDLATKAAHEHVMLMYKEPSVDTLSPNVCSTLHDESPVIRTVPTLMAIATRAAIEHGISLDKDHVRDILPKVTSIPPEEPSPLPNVPSLKNLATKTANEHGLLLNKEPKVDTPPPKFSSPSTFLDECPVTQKVTSLKLLTQQDQNLNVPGWIKQKRRSAGKARTCSRNGSARKQSSAEKDRKAPKTPKAPEETNGIGNENVALDVEHKQQLAASEDSGVVIDKPPDTAKCKDDIGSDKSDASRTMTPRKTNVNCIENGRRHKAPGANTSAKYCTRHEVAVTVSEDKDTEIVNLLQKVDKNDAHVADLLGDLELLAELETEVEKQRRVKDELKDKTVSDISDLEEELVKTTKQIASLRETIESKNADEQRFLKLREHHIDENIHDLKCVLRQMDRSKKKTKAPHIVPRMTQHALKLQHEKGKQVHERRLKEGEEQRQMDKRMPKKMTDNANVKVGRPKMEHTEMRRNLEHHTEIKQRKEHDEMRQKKEHAEMRQKKEHTEMRRKKEHNEMRQKKEHTEMSQKMEHTEMSQKKEHTEMRQKKDNTEMRQKKEHIENRKPRCIRKGPLRPVRATKATEARLKHIERMKEEAAIKEKIEEMTTQELTILKQRKEFSRKNIDPPKHSDIGKRLLPKRARLGENVVKSSTVRGQQKIPKTDNGVKLPPIKGSTGDPKGHSKTGPRQSKHKMDDSGDNRQFRSPPYIGAKHHVTRRPEWQD